METCIAGAEFAERTAFFGVTVNIITYLFTVKHIHLADAANMVTNFLGASYVFTLVGGFLADTFIGRYWTIVIFILVQTLVRIQLLYLAKSKSRFTQSSYANYQMHQLILLELEPTSKGCIPLHDHLNIHCAAFLLNAT